MFNLEKRRNRGDVLTLYSNLKGGFIRLEELLGTVLLSCYCASAKLGGLKPYPQGSCNCQEVKLCLLKTRGKTKTVFIAVALLTKDIGEPLVCKNTFSFSVLDKFARGYSLNSIGLRDEKFMSCSTVDEGGATDAICLYLCKALDTVQPGRLISKLERRGADRRTTRWIRNQLKFALEELWSMTQCLSGER
ncbi:hypothetical protein DUI87_16909 [Hirundo rustica rustica]|uniref:Uncharacterized protein n=1 Tax=Hirundo rustica rustica TaxID=333673 RepID=A0A3M0K8R0_HIRRU|nr:hypothetical protein DUI87_16909 [Hirundo rustica rustica]